MKINVIGFYKIKKINKLKKHQNLLKKFFSKRFVKGIVILTPEGINGTIAGKKKNITECIDYIRKKFYIKKFDSKSFSNINYYYIFIFNKFIPIFWFNIFMFFFF